MTNSKTVGKPHGCCIILHVGKASGLHFSRMHLKAKLSITADSVGDGVHENPAMGCRLISL